MVMKTYLAVSGMMNQLTTTKGVPTPAKTYSSAYQQPEKSLELTHAVLRPKLAASSLIRYGTAIFVITPKAADKAAANPEVWARNR